MAVAGLARRLVDGWYEQRLPVSHWPLLPLSWTFAGLAALRRLFYRCGLLTSARLPLPVVVVGNLTVGGSGKTPLVLWLVRNFRERGWHPGVISRGYGGAGQGIQAVTAASLSALVGDEPVLLARRGGVPVFVGRDRCAAASALLAAHPECDVIISDDGLQHYHLQRTLELAVLDGRGAGNGRLLPAGPLREPLWRLAQVSAVIWNGIPDARAEKAARSTPRFAMRLVGDRFVALGGPTEGFCTAQSLAGRKLYAIAGIGDPQRFFRHLSTLGLEFEAHPFPDHQPYSEADLAFARDGVLLMTEKDAVKCSALSLGEAWVLPVDAAIGAEPGQSGLFEMILERLDGRPSA